MKVRRVVALAVMAGGLGLGLRQWGTRAVASDAAAPFMVASAVPAFAGEGGQFTYVGSTACKKCHLKEHKSWAETKMGKAFETLKPGQAKETKEKFKLDVNKNYSQDPTCIKCHTTGHGKPGGYAIPKADDAKAVKEAAKLEGVGCESCHGPGSEYVRVFEEITKSNRKYKVEELYKVGLTKIEESTCTACHNPEGPTVDLNKPFDFAKMKEEDRHERVPMKQREG